MILLKSDGNTCRLQRIGKCLLIVPTVAAVWFVFPVLRRWAEFVPLPVAVGVFASYVCVSLLTDVIQCIDPESVLRRVFRRRARQVESAALTEAELRRNWFLGLARSYFLAFLIAAASLGVSMHSFFFIEPVLLAFLGEGKTVLIFAVAMFASLLVPMCALMMLFGMHPRFRCPHCRRYLSDLDAVKRLNRDACCRFCEQSMPIAPITTRDQCINCLSICLGAISLVVLLCAWT